MRSQVKVRIWVTYKCWVTDKLSCQPQERLLEVIIRLGRDIIVLKVLLAMEGDCLCLNFSLLYVDLVSSEDDWDVLADTDQVTYHFC